MTNSREIHYPIFLRCCKYISELFWKNIFEELAYGRTPIGICIVNNQLRCILKNKSFVYNIKETNDEKKIQIIAQEVYNLIALRFGLKNQIKLILKNSKESNTLDWKSIKKTNIKHIYIENYVIECGKKWGLNLQLQKELVSTINSHIVLKNITSKHIKFSGTKITNISGLTFEKGKFIFNLHNINE